MAPVDAFQLTVVGPPHGQGRPRMTRTGHAYTPPETRAHTALVQGEWIAAGRPRLPDGCWWRCEISAYDPRPASHLLADGVSLSAVGRRTRHPGKPDLDNRIKHFLDSLVAVGAIPDDARCVAINAVKRWAPAGVDAHTVCTFTVSAEVGR